MNRPSWDAPADDWFNFLQARKQLGEELGRQDPEYQEYLSHYRAYNWNPMSYDAWVRGCTTARETPELETYRQEQLAAWMTEEERARRRKAQASV